MYLHCRFEQILRYLQVSDPATEVERGQPGYGKLQKVRPLISLLSEQFQAQYDLSQDVTIDEAMIPFKGRLGYKQYIKAKPTKWGYQSIRPR